MSLKSAEKTGVNEYTLALSIDGAAFEGAVNKVYHKQKGKINVPGFRKGKAPRRFIEKMYGENVFYDDALEEVFPAVYEAAVQESGISPVDSPRDFDIEQIGADGVELTCKVTVKPEIALGEYKGLSAAREDVSVTVEEVEHEIEHAQKHNARQVDVDDRPAQDKDIANIDFEGYVDGVAFDGGKAEGHELTIGSGQFIPGFEEQLIGHSIGEPFDINVTFPEEYGAEELAGKDAVFKIKLNSIRVEELPELDDEFAKDVSEFDTFEEYKKDVEASILKGKQESADKKIETAVLDALAEKVEGEIPDVMVEKAIDNIITDFEYRLQSSGMNFDMYLQYTGMDREAFRENYRDGALNSVKTELALEKIVEAEGIVVSEEEIEAEYASVAEKYNMEVEKVKGLIPAEHVKQDLTSKKAIAFVIDAAVATEPEEADEAEDAPAEKKEAAPKKPAKKAAKKKEEAAEAEEEA
ncbi:MAG: trigger factor [Oscillospiraceae bacterium]|nr:trigger factor [Oscillospiraceae bacterium]